MKTNYTKLAFLAALSLSATTAVWAESDTGLHSKETPVRESGATSRAVPVAPYGYATSGGEVGRVINVDDKTRWVNVTRHETVRINLGGKSVVWRFDTLSASSFPLSRIVDGAGAVTVYVAENPDYRGS